MATKRSNKDDEATAIPFSVVDDIIQTDFEKNMKTSRATNIYLINLPLHDPAESEDDGADESDDDIDFGPYIYNDPDSATCPSSFSIGKKNNRWMWLDFLN